LDLLGDAETPGSRKQFVDSAVKYLRDNGFDGLDLDWEYPSEPTRGGRAMDTANYVKLLRDVRAGFDGEKLPAGKEKLLFTTASPPACTSSGTICRRSIPRSIGST